MKIIYMQRTVHLILSSGVKLPKEHILNNELQPEVGETKNGERYLIFNIT